MPVMVTGVENVVGRRAVDLLVSKGGEVRVFVQAAAPDATPAEQSTVEALRADLRGMRCKVAHGFTDDEGHVETALEQVHTVLHLMGRPGDDPESHLERTATVIGAAIGAGCRRLVVLSDLAVGAPEGNSWLEVLAEAEDMAADAPMESVILRAALILGGQDPLTQLLAGTAPDVLPEGGEHWPIPAGAVAATAVMADAERGLDTTLHVEVPLAGAKQARARDLPELAAELLDGHQSSPGLPAGSPLPGTVLDLLARTIPRPPDAIGKQASGPAEAST